MSTSSRLPFYIGLLIVSCSIPDLAIGQNEKYQIAPGPYQGTNESLDEIDYQCPEWFRDAKFGIWAHWGPQSQPGRGDWYARQMYFSDGDKFEKIYLDNPENWNIGHWKSNIGQWEKGAGKMKSRYHRKTFGHQTTAGYKDVCRAWKAEKLDAEKLIGQYKRAGAKYVAVIGHHHDNFDLWDSKAHPWNSVRVGPKKDIVRMFEQATRSAGLKFAVSLHPARTDWFAGARVMSDSDGPHKGKLYDGSLTLEDGKGTWWEGLDPQKLYGKPGSEYRDWTAEEKHEYFLRAKDLIDNYQLDLLYFDEGRLPRGEAGPFIAAHFFNTNIARNGKNEAVLNIKGHRKFAIPDTERGVSDRKRAKPWQTDTCLGSWFYTVPKLRKWKTTDHAVKVLVDIVSKNGNLMLSVPMPGSGELDSRGATFMEEMGQWMDINGEGIYGTRPWVTFGEYASPKNIGNAHHNEKSLIFGDDEYRFTQKDGAIYAFALSWPNDLAKIKSLSNRSPFISGNVTAVTLLGHGAVSFSQTDDALEIQTPDKPPGNHAYCFKVEGLTTHDELDMSGPFYTQEYPAAGSPPKTAYTFDNLKFGELIGQDGFQGQAGIASVIPFDVTQKNRRVVLRHEGVITKKVTSDNGSSAEQSWQLPGWSGEESAAVIEFDVFNESYSQVTLQLTGAGTKSPMFGLVGGNLAFQATTPNSNFVRASHPDFDARRKWVRVRMVMDFSKDTATVSARPLDDSKQSFKPVAKLTDLKMGLKSSSFDPAAWTAVNVTMKRRRQESNHVMIDNLKIGSKD